MEKRRGWKGGVLWGRDLIQSCYGSSGGEIPAQRSKGMETNFPSTPGASAGIVLSCGLLKGALPSIAVRPAGLAALLTKLLWWLGKTWLLCFVEPCVLHS